MSLVGNSWIFKLSLFTKTVLETEPYPIQANLELLQASKPLKFAENLIKQPRVSCRFSLKHYQQLSKMWLAFVCQRWIRLEKSPNKLERTPNPPIVLTRGASFLIPPWESKWHCTSLVNAFLNSPLTPTVTLSSRLFFGVKFLGSKRNIAIFLLEASNIAGMGVVVVGQVVVACDMANVSGWTAIGVWVRKKFTSE